MTDPFVIAIAVVAFIFGWLCGQDSGWAKRARWERERGG